MGDWKLTTLFAQADTIRKVNLDRWPAHAAYFDAVVHFLSNVGWIPERLNARARREAGERVAALQKLVWVPPGSDAFGERVFPNEPASPVEAQSISLHYAALVVVRSLAMSGYHMFGGLVLEAAGAHRRTIEGLRHMDILVHDSQIAVHYWRAAWHSTRAEQSSGEFKQAVDNHWSLIANVRHPEARLTRLQRRLRPQASDGILNLGAHAGMMHAITASADLREGTDFFDVGFRHIGGLAWRLATQTVQLAGALAAECDWIDKQRWKAGYDVLIAQARGLEIEDRRITGQQDFSGCPWTTLADQSRE